MNYSKALNIRTDNFSLIGQIVKSDGVSYRVEDLIISPLQHIRMVYEDYIKTYDFSMAAARFLSSDELEVFLYCVNLTTDNYAVIRLVDLD